MEGKLRFTGTYEYIIADAGTGIVGISKEASDKLGDIYLVDLPEVGKEVKKGDEVGVIESVKTASDIYAPACGKIIAVNDSLAEKPELISEDPMGEGWIFKIKLSDESELDELMDQCDFKKFVKEQ